MIRNRLKELMAERGLKASRVANDIENLSRNTINSTVNNNGKMIQFETVNSLCQYLGVTPNEFFEYLPFDVDVSVNSDKDFLVVGGDESSIQGYIKPFYLNLYLTKEKTNLSSGITKKTFELSAVLRENVNFEINDAPFNRNFLPTNAFDFTVVLGNPPESKNNNYPKEFNKFWNEDLTPGFRQDIEETIQEKIIQYFNQQIKSNDLTDWVEFSNAQFNVNFRFDEKIKANATLESGPILYLESEKINIPDNELPF